MPKEEEKTKTQLGKEKRLAEKAARKAASDARRAKTAKIQAAVDDRVNNGTQRQRAAAKGMDKREREAGLNLRGNDPMAGRRTPVQQVGTQGNGINFTSTQMNATGGGGKVSNPFQLVGAGNKLYLRKGTVNSVVPTYDGTELDDDYTENELTLPGASSTQAYWLKAVSTGDLDDEGVTTVTVEDSEPSDDTAAQAKLLLGSVTTDGNIDVDGTPFSNLSGSQNLDSCGANHSWNVI